MFKKICTALALVSVLGCQASQPEFHPKPTVTQVEVVNNNWNDVTVYMWQDASYKRLGIVTATTTATYKLEQVGAHSMSFEVKLLAGPRWRSDKVMVHKGDRVQLYIENALQHSSVAVYAR